MEEIWLNISEGVPTYYKVVFAELKNGEIIKVWRASNGDYNIWTKFGTDQVFFDDDIVKWKRHKLEPKECQ